MKSLFNKQCPDNLNYNEIEIKDMSKYWSEELINFFYNNFAELVNDIKKDDGFKVRVPFTTPEQMLELSKTLPFFCDNLVFSPAPL